MLDSVDEDDLPDEVCANIARRWLAVQQEVSQIAVSVGRDPLSVSIVGVTKYVPLPFVRALYQAGCRDFGESRPQQLWERAERLSKQRDIRWHLIGHLQRNKVTKTVPVSYLMHSVDSLRLIEAISEAASSRNEIAKVLLEVKISADESKHGLAPVEIEQVLYDSPKYHGIEIQGLMGMASLGSSSAQALREFEELSALRDSLQRKFPDVEFKQLSMGMSGDFREAIMAGATIVRIGSHLWEGIAP